MSEGDYQQKRWKSGLLNLQSINLRALP